jgi:hypothetical protein
MELAQQPGMSIPNAHNTVQDILGCTRGETQGKLPLHYMFILSTSHQELVKYKLICKQHKTSYFTPNRFLTAWLSVANFFFLY